jgi:SHS2 domain-containing protein
VTARHELREHIGEVAVWLRADTPAELLAEAARALAELMLGEDGVGGVAGAAAIIEVRAPDLTTLLIDWLNELVFRADVDKAVYTEAAVVRASEREVVARLRGIVEPPLKTAVKAATFHGARVIMQDGAYEATVVLDV